MKKCTAKNASMMAFISKKNRSILLIIKNIYRKFSENQGSGDSLLFEKCVNKKHST